MACSPECPSTHTCIEMAGNMTCVPQCSPKCKAGDVCLLTASSPVCVPPNPTDFTLLITMQVGCGWAPSALRLMAARCFQ